MESSGTDDQDTLAVKADHWEAVYASRPETGFSWYQAEPELSLRLIERTGLAANEPFIDVGGGASILVDRLLQRGYADITVLDISAAAICKSQKRLGPSAHAVKWIATDIMDFRPSRQYAFWHDRALFHFLTNSSQRRRYVAVLDATLKANGQAIISTFAVGGPEKCSGLEIMQYDSERLLHELGPEFKLLEQLQEVHLTPSGKQQSFAYFRILKTA